MARIELEITGNADGLSKAADKGASSMGKLTLSAKQFDDAARRNSMEQYERGLNNVGKRADGTTGKLRLLNRELSLINKNDLKFSFGTGDDPRVLSRHIGDLSNQTKVLTNSFRGANTVGIEFSRIIQDAPYGIIGVGNNITQLTQSFANLRAQTGSTSQALKTAFTSMFSGANLLVLGVSLATTAWTLYSQSASKARKETEEIDNGTKRYIDTLEGVARAHADGAVNAQKDLAQLNLLYRASQDQTLAMADRRKAAEELIRQYPRQFQGLTTEAVLAGKAAEAYDRLSKSLLETAKVSAIYSRVADNQAKILDKQLRLADLANKRTQLVARRDAQLAAVTQAQQQATGLASGSLEAGLARRAQNQLDELNKQILDNQLEIGKITTENNDLQESYNKLIGEGADLSGRLATGLEKAKKKTETAADKLQESLNKLTQESIQASLTGNAKELQASQNKYDELRRQADEYYREGKIKAKEYADYLARLQGFRIAENARIVGPAQRVPLGGPSTGPSTLPVSTIAKTAVVDLTTDPVWDAFVDDLDKQLGRAVHSFGRDFMRTLTTINQQAGVTFGGVVSGLIGSLTEGLTEVMSTVFSKQLGEAIQGAFGSGGLGKTGTYGAAGAAIIGSIISGSTKRTSVGGQALGGALTGAGTGAALGSVVPGLGTAVGAVVGAVVGALGGILGASSAKKQEKQQDEILKEQRKQTALLERQNALTYASSIVGQMTAGGLVSGVMRDAFGQLVATVKGSDLQFVLQRAGGSR